MIILQLVKVVNVVLSGIVRFEPSVYLYKPYLLLSNSSLSAHNLYVYCNRAEVNRTLRMSV